ncbi:hypothetical protein AOQ84DRAFT_164543 [Glonium stellatum]|uniref:MYND-type domain-containing protein n=1 Tax=Glonium stellatum TaxID=574774 RepID=A0A8E2EQA6_9PEZI|nr:hypothetical protein AOQ84DRAFT_164543 [Glonium stellatum]
MATPTCVICNGSDAKFCSLCHSISYCSPECQKPDWPLHKMICKTFTTLPLRPSPSHKLAILFPVDSKDPQLIWIKCERHVDDEDGIAWEMPDTQHLLEIENLDLKYQHAREFKSITRSVLRGFNLSYTVQVICRETFLIDGSTPNVCVRHTTKGQMTHDWRGPIVVTRQPGTAIDPLFYEDIKAGDFRVAIDYFLSY